VTDHDHHPCVLIGRITATPELAKERPGKPPRTTFIVRGRYSRRRVRVHAVDRLAADVCNALHPGDVATFSGTMTERHQDGSVFRFLLLDSFMVHPGDAA
jgi:hypothetical protein